MRRHAAVIAIAAAMLAAPLTAAAAGSAETVAKKAPPNIVVIMTDDQTLEQLRVMPETQRLIGDAGVTYENFVVNEPLCCPSRATFLTGQYSHHHGVLTNSPPNGGYSRFDNTTAMPVWLQAAGYRTILIGKFMNGYGVEDKTEVPPGWSDWQGMINQEYYDYDLNDNGTIVHYGTDAADYSTDVLVGRAEEAIAESAPGGPFFLDLALFAPHTTTLPDTSFRSPLPAPRHEGMFADEEMPKPPSFNERKVGDKPAHIQAINRMKATQIAEIETRYRDELESLLAVDEAVARVISALSKAGELRNTVVVFVSDNGFLHGEHRIRSQKSSPYEEAIHVPLMVRGPGFAPGTSVDKLASNIDLAPTIAAIAGATPLLQVDGTDLRDLPDNRSVMIETYDEKCFTGLRTETDVYVRYFTGEEEYYDLTDDPYQLVSEHDKKAAAGRVAELRAALDAVEPNPVPPCAE